MEATVDYEPWSATDTLFHLLIADASASQRLVARVAELRAEVYRITRHVPTPRETVELADREHREILKAIRARRPERARAAMVRQVESTRALWLGLGRVDIESVAVDGRTVHRVRVGPLADAAAADALLARIERLGLGAPRVAIER